MLPCTDQHVAGLCNQAVPNRRHSKLRLDVPFPRECVQYRCVECSRSVDVAHNFGERTLQEHRTGDGSYVPCSGTLLPYAMPKLLHDATGFDLLPPGTPSDGTQPTMPDKEQLRLEALHAAKQCWLQALRACCRSRLACSA